MQIYADIISLTVHLYGKDNPQEDRLSTHISITRMRNRDQYRKSIRGVSGLAVDESKNAHLL